jgi:NhaA family Na+:H+ antiporter
MMRKRGIKRIAPGSDDKSRGLFSITNFFESQLASGIITVSCVLAALILANIPVSGVYFSVLETEMTLSAGLTGMTQSLRFWINDCLMTFFFLLIGFEIKRELIAGELSQVKKAAFPLVAAIGGMAVPIAVFLFLNIGSPYVRGWGIPMSTDIAFVISIMLLLGRRISKSLVVSVTAVAIIDDIGALIVISIFYSQSIVPVYFIWIAGIVAIVALLNKLNLGFGFVYLAAGILLWLMFRSAGVHPTISGVVIAFLIPSNTRIDFVDFKNRISGLANRIDGGFRNEEWHFERADERSKKTFNEMENVIKSVEPPLQRYEKRVAKFVNFIVIPAFALSNAGVVFTGISFADLTTPLFIGIAAGLMLGKSTGVISFSYIFSRLKLVRLPEETGFARVYGTGWLAGIGFTMSLFIAELSFSDEHLLSIAKTSIFAASVLSAVTGTAIIFFAGRSRNGKPADRRKAVRKRNAGSAGGDRALPGKEKKA